MLLNGGELDGVRVLKKETVAEMTRKQTGDLTARPGMPWGLGFSQVEDPAKMTANSVLAPNSFGHGGAFSTQSWADPVHEMVFILMVARQNFGNGDGSDIRADFQKLAVEAVKD